MLHGEDCEWCRNTTRTRIRRITTRRLSQFIQRRTSPFVFLTLCLFIFMVITYTLHIHIDLIAHDGKQGSVGCYFETKDNILDSVDDLDIPEDSIFFHETSCSGGLNSRQACTVEAAAKLHPNRTVFVLFNSPVTKHSLESTKQLRLQLPNIRLAKLDIRTYGRGTPVADVLVETQFNERPWMTEHTADILRYATLYKYGGVYLDLDTLLVKNIDSLGQNWVCREDSTTVSAGTIAFSKHGIGRKMAEITVNDLQWNFKPWEWSTNSIGTITRAVLSICSKDLEIVPTEDGDVSCQGFTVYNPVYFYPIHYKRSKKYFNSDPSFRETPEVYGHHVWNRLTKHLPVMPNSPFDVLTKKYCPIVRSMYGDAFGA